MNVNLHGIFYSMRAEIQQMLKQEPIVSPSHAAQGLAGQRGSIVNIASVLGLVGISSACA
jgi:NAD(P)-dependent dehydrogenase (short-subunit alcohol dehydrogenase family)